MLSRVDGLRTGRTPFVLATVVRAERPTSAKPGDCALVLADGTIDGFVGGVCAESTVRLESLRLLQSGESGLLRITPRAGDADEPAQEGVRTVGNPCLSGGTLEIFLEAMIPPVLVSVYGEAPVARALARVGHSLDWDVRSGVDPSAPIASDTSAVVVASHGRDEATVLRAALAAGVDYVALVASRRRSAGVLDELAALGVDEEQRARIHAPAGLDIGARTAAEIALSVFADIVAHRPRVTLPPVEGAPEPWPSPRLEIASDPVCGMDVAVTPSSISAQYGGKAVYFCGTGCRQAFLDDPGRFGR
ncbi:MAG: XshC-Cox1-family protein [Pseudonocardia sp.]|jgi:xanthine dehydrogenase accessory factor|nr:XshC-Cox1-family protein [Pseudonocardia sp.]MDT7618721.1 xanthine dehydrogenase accessory factor [Pseudonocardiales bacterium]